MGNKNGNKKFSISEEEAKKQIEKAFLEWGVDETIEEIENSDDKNLLPKKNILRKLVTYFKNGLLEVSSKNDEFSIKHNLFKPIGTNKDLDFLNYLMPRASQIKSLDRVSDEKPHSKGILCVSMVSGVSENVLGNLTSKDLGIAEMVYSLFFSLM